MSTGDGVVAVSYPLFGNSAVRAAVEAEVFVPVEHSVELVSVARRQRIVGLVLRSELRLDRTLLAALPALRFVVRAGSGLDGIDTAELARRGIRLFRNPDEAAGSVAELAWLGLIALARRLPTAISVLRRGGYDKHLVLGDAVGDLMIVVWGAGRIGRAVLAAAHRWGASATPVDLGRSLPDGMTGVDPASAVATADAHIFCLPLTAESRGRFGQSFLDAVADRRPYLCNVARYELLDMPGAVAALRAGRLRGLFVDPVDRDHLRDVRAGDWLTGDHNLLLTMHQGAQRADVRRRLDEWAVATALHQLACHDDEGRHGSSPTTTGRGADRHRQAAW
jgi:D-3-phosphoglycerate dehydrogenase / 2-oxoglutarate reductase